MRKIFLFTIVFSYTLCGTAQIINTSIFGQNANLTDTIGVNTNTGGHLEEFWNTGNPSQNFIFQSNAKQMRYGGILVELNCKIDGNVGNNPPSNIDKTIADYIRKVLVMQDNGITPMLTLPLLFGANEPITTLSLSASQVALLVKGVNDGLKAKGRTICTHWIYSNEPEHGGLNSINKPIHGYDSVDAGVKIHAYIQAYYNSVKSVWAANQTAWGIDTTQIKFVGPELYSFDNYNHGTGMEPGADSLIDQLTGINTSHGNNNILPFLSSFSFHYYPFGDEGADTSQSGFHSGDFVKATDTNLVNILTTPVWIANHNYQTSPLANQLDYLNGIITNYNSTVPAYKKVRVAITEANLCYKNDVHNTSGVAKAADLSATGTSANGQMGGQFWAELLSLCMQKGVDINYWSSVEGDPSDSFSTDIGFLSGNDTSLGRKKPSFYHFKMLADNFRGTYHGGGYNQNSASPTPTFPKGIKTFASAEAAGFHIMILNENDALYDFHINFDSSGTNVSGSLTLDLKITNSYGGSLDTSHYDSSLPIKGHSTALHLLIAEEV